MQHSSNLYAYIITDVPTLILFSLITPGLEDHELIIPSLITLSHGSFANQTETQTKSASALPEQALRAL